jgi:hypothetical protein
MNLKESLLSHFCGYYTAHHMLPVFIFPNPMPRLGLGKKGYRWSLALRTRHALVQAAQSAQVFTLLFIISTL